MVKMTDAIPRHLEDASHALERLTLELHVLIRAGRGNDDEADQVREQMVDIWQTLTPERRNLLDDLSGDLFMLAGNEEFETGEGTIPSKASFANAWKRQDWVELLSLTRNGGLRAQLSDAVTAYFRGRCWSSLGHFEAAATFFDYAAQLAPENENYAYLALDALVRSGRTGEALERANAILRVQNPSVRGLFKAADILFHAARDFDETAAAAVYTRALLVLDRALALDAQIPPNERLSSLTVGGYVVKGLCHEHLAQPADAIQAYTAALAVDPDAEAPLTARGLLLLDSDRATALRDFERAVKKGTPLPWPYLYLAHDALESGEFRRCLEMAESALARTRAPVLRANLMEWKAIASMRLVPGSKTSIALMQDAQTFNPLSERIAANLKNLLAGKPRDDLSVANDTSPREAMEAFSRELQPTG
jgi:tetratricopeptide (TPR) repeat protein